LNRRGPDLPSRWGALRKIHHSPHFGCGGDPEILVLAALGPEQLALGAPLGFFLLLVLPGQFLLPLLKSRSLFVWHKVSSAAMPPWLLLPARLARRPASAPMAAATATSPPVAETASSAGWKAAAPAIHFRARLIDINGAALHVFAVQRRDCLLPIVGRHFHESESARFPGITVGHDLNRLHLSEGFEECCKIALADAEGQVAYENSQGVFLQCPAGPERRARGRAICAAGRLFDLSMFNGITGQR